MINFNRLCLCILSAVMVTVVCMTGNAFAASLPEAENEAKTTERINFHGHSALTTFRGEMGGVVGRLSCEKDLVNNGSFLVPGKLAEKFDITLSGKCELVFSGVQTACNEPILTHVLRGLLGYIKGNSGTVGLLVKPETGTEWFRATCGVNTVTISGEVVGEIPENNSKGAKQYNKIITELEVHFARVAGKETEQAVTTFELPTGFPAPLSMTGIGLSVTGFFGGKASMESTETLLLGALMILRA